jgi:hypothetical protein
MKNELDVRAALKRAAEPAEREIPPAIDALLPLGRRRRRVRMASMVLAAVGLIAAVLGSLVLVNQAFRSPASAPADGNEDSADRGTYLLSDFAVTYPYQPRGADAPDDTLAGVRFTAAWSTDLFPGHADCRLILRDASGDVVGTLPFGLDLTRTPFSLSPHTVEVSAPPRLSRWLMRARRRGRATPSRTCRFVPILTRRDRPASPSQCNGPRGSFRASDSARHTSPPLTDGRSRIPSACPLGRRERGSH